MAEFQNVILLLPIKTNICQVQPDLCWVQQDFRQVKLDRRQVRADLRQVRADLRRVRADLRRARSDLLWVRPDLHWVRPDLPHWWSCQFESNSMVVSWYLWTLWFLNAIKNDLQSHVVKKLIRIKMWPPLPCILLSSQWLQLQHINVSREKRVGV